MTKIPPISQKSPNMLKTTKYPKNLKNDQNAPPKLKKKMIKISQKPKKWPKYHQNLKMTKIPPKPNKLPKYSRNLKNDPNTLETQNNYQNTLKTQKITKIPLKPKKWPKYTSKPKNDQIAPKTQKMTKIPSKLKNWPKYL